MFENGARMDTLPLVYYKLTLWDFGSGELNCLTMKLLDYQVRLGGRLHCPFTRIQKIFSGGGGGGWGVQIPRRGLTENFNMAKINNLATPGGGSGPPVPPSGSAHVRLI